MKRIMCTTAAMLLAVALTACTGASETPVQTSAQTENDVQKNGENLETASDNITYPEKTIQVVVPFNAGSTTDTQFRFIQPYLEKQLGVSLAVVNNGGASGVIGTTGFLAEKTDGYTVLFSLPTPTLYKAAAGETEYAVEDLVPVCEVSSAPMYLIVGKDAPYEDGAALIEYIKANPGEFTYASAGNGGIAHMAFATFLFGEGLEATSVPFSGGTADCYTAVMGGHVESYCGNENELQGRDDVRPLINLGSKSTNPAFADIPTLEELGYPGYVTDTFSGFYFSKDVDPAIVKKFDSAVAAMMEDPEFMEAAKTQSFSAYYADSETLTAQITQSKENLVPVFEELGIKK